MDPTKRKFYQETVLEFRFGALAKKRFEDDDVDPEMTPDEITELVGQDAVRSDLPISIGIKYPAIPEQIFHEMECA